MVFWKSGNEKEGAEKENEAAPLSTNPGDGLRLISGAKSLNLNPSTEYQERVSIIPNSQTKFLPSSSLLRNVISEGIRFQGDLHFDMPIRIDGCFSGTLRSSSEVHIFTRAKIKADLKAKSLTS